jgi:fatty-acid peroxygenase
MSLPTTHDRDLPGTTAFDSSVALLRDGYEFGAKRRRRYGSDVFATRLLLRRTICMSGAEAARVFYDPERFVRRGAAPRRLRKTLFGEGGVQGLDGAAFSARKQLFVAMLAPDRLCELTRLADREWRRRIGEWESRDRVTLHTEAREIHTRAVCAWAGVPLDDAAVGPTARLLGRLIDSPAALGPGYLAGRIARLRADRWAARVVAAERRRTDQGGGTVPTSVLGRIAAFRDPAGRLLAPRTAGVELLNVLRPTVAVARFVTFAALALHRWPEWRERLAAPDTDPDADTDLDTDLEPFVQEVRRHFPFFPVVAARVRTAFEWNGYRFPAGRRVLLDLYGTNHDPRLWERPDEFRPERFRERSGSPFDFIPQGGGDHERNHRCPGEWITIALLKTAVRVLAAGMTYDVPPQDLRVPLSTMPAIPNSGFVLTRVRRSPTDGAPTDGAAE